MYTYSKFHCVIATKMTGILLCPAVFFAAVPLSHHDALRRLQPEQMWRRQAPLCPILHINNYMYFGYFHGGLYMWLWYAQQPNFVCIFISFRLNTQPDVIFASPVEQPLRAAHSLRSVDPAARWTQPSTIIKQKKDTIIIIMFARAQGSSGCPWKPCKIFFSWHGNYWYFYCYLIINLQKKHSFKLTALTIWALLHVCVHELSTMSLLTQTRFCREETPYN